MKKQAAFITLAAMAPAAAFAQVSVSGTIDLAARRVDNGVVKSYLLQREGASSSKFVVSGREDLGDGAAAGFYLDSSLRADTGSAASTFWERRSTVSLYSSYGEIRLGRDAALQNSIPGDFDALNGKGVGNVMNLATPFNFSATNDFTRVSNAVSYLTPAKLLNGFYGQIQVAPSEGGVGNKHIAFGLGYAKGPLEVRFTRGMSDTNQVATVNPVTGASAKALSPDKFDTAAATAQGHWTYTSFGTLYNFGPIQVMGSVIQWVSATELTTGSTRKQLTYNLGGMVPVGASGSVNFAYTRANRSGLGSDEQDADQLALQYMHNLSKRTSLYASVAQLRQDQLATVVNSRYNMDGTDVVGRKALGFDFGVRHKF